MEACNSFSAMVLTRSLSQADWRCRRWWTGAIGGGGGDLGGCGGCWGVLRVPQVTSESPVAPLSDGGLIFVRFIKKRGTGLRNPGVTCGFPRMFHLLPLSPFVF